MKKLFAYILIFSTVLLIVPFPHAYGATTQNVSLNTPANSLGLGGYWTLDGPDITWSSATAGTDPDLSGSGNTGTLTSMSKSASAVLGKIGQALDFDGTADYVATAS